MSGQVSTKSAAIPENGSAPEYVLK